MLVFTLAVAAAVGAVFAAAFLFRKSRHGADDRGPGSTTAGHAGSMLSSLFLLAFAIAIVVPWTTADSARQNTQAESQSIVDAYWAAAALPAPAGTQVQASLRDYVRFIVDNEWHVMAKGRLSEEGWARLDTLRAQVTGLHVSGTAAEAARSTLLDRIRDMSAARGQRAVDAKATPPKGLLALTVVGAVLTCAFPFLAGARPRGTALIPAAAMTAMLTIGVYVTFDISHVFSGALRVKPDAFTAAQQEFPRIPESR
ncbi:DUF4239 domain-containing protein [Actinoallomurus purpureus]|uniref:bestrophin-like domain n=1 Tax=Actinoallomurus purpureus TaxID=478114 RepID=UPI0020937D2B|nr:DUF4239 domain-containing protein [Actinoallomurus purpureus]MCO6007065.1 DUF4239 domain-containing protein [Actinoallomurus purpureus]